MTPIKCDKCSKTNVRHITEPEDPISMNQYAREYGRYTNLLYRPKKHKLVCRDCGYTVSFEEHTNQFTTLYNSPVYVSGL